MHDFNRTPVDIIRIVKIHETTLRKRLLEFGDTPSSVLTIEEFMTVDLEAEQDPPAFKAARKKDKEMIQRIAENEQEFSELQREIEANLERDMSKGRKRLLEGPLNVEQQHETDFIRDSTIETIKGCIQEGDTVPETTEVETELIAPDIMAICNAPVRTTTEAEVLDADTILDDLEDDEINSYILDEAEAKRKSEMWTALNADYLEEVRLRQEQVDKEREEGKPEKKRKKTTKKKPTELSTTAGEAIEKILQEKKISSKINYDILKSLTDKTDPSAASSQEMLLAKEEKELEVEAVAAASHSMMLPSRRKVAASYLLPGNSRSHRKKMEVGLPVATEADQTPKLEKVVETGEIGHIVGVCGFCDVDFVSCFPATATTQEEAEEEPEVEVETEPAGHSSLATMLNDGAGEDEFGYDEDYY